MFRIRGSFRLLVILIGLWFVSGASAAALACVSPATQIATVAPMQHGCPEMPKSHDHSAACAPMCAAIPAHLACVESPRLVAAPLAAPPMSFLPLGQIGPDPPPPRLG